MRVLLVTEKQFVAEAIIASLERTDPWPGATVTMVATVIAGFYKFAYPEGMKAADFPYVGDVMLRHGNRMMRHGGPEKVSLGKPGTHLVMPSETPCMADALRSLVDSNDIVVGMTEWNHRGEVAFGDLVGLGGKRVLPANIRLLRAKVVSLAPAALDAVTARLADAVENQIDMVTEWDPGNDMLRQGRARDFFDWNWGLNARALLAAPMVAAGIPRQTCGVASVGYMSKYGLLLSLHMARCLDRVEFLTEGEAIGIMEKWEGSGKYPPSATTGLGSVTSRAQILKNLLELGLLEMKRDRYLKTTPKAHAFSSLLPKAAYDPDLPFRLDAWSRQWPGSKDAMSSYIRRFFGNIKRRNGANGVVSSDKHSLNATSAARAMEATGMTPEGIASAAQVPAKAVEAVLKGGDVTPGQAMGIALAARRTVC